MSVKTNTIANYVGRIYIIAAGMIVLPLFMQYMGEEAYGLVGLFTLVQTWIQLFNMGLAPTLGREAARASSKSSEHGFQAFYRVLVSYELIFAVLVIALFCAALLGGDWLVGSWLNIEQLAEGDVKLAVLLLLGAAILRFQSSLYRSGMMGLEKQVYVNALEMVFVSLRFPAALLLVALVSSDVVYFFIYQLVLSAVELVWIRSAQFRAIPHDAVQAYRFYWWAIKPTIPFAAGIAYTAGIWVLVTQIDKVILSGILTLSEFGYYSLVALITGGLIQLTHPLSEAIRPRMTALHEAGNNQALYALYLSGTQFVAAITFSACFVITFNAQPLLYAWTGNQGAALWGAEVLQWFVLGSGLLAVAAFQYYLQFAHGRLRLHVIGSSISACVQIPVMAYAAYEYGALGAAKAWLFVRLLFFIAWVPVVHRAFSKGLHTKWLGRHVLPPALAAFLASAVMFVVSNYMLSEQSSRLVIALWIGLQSLIVLVASLITIPSIRNWLKGQRLKRLG